MSSHAQNKAILAYHEVMPESNYSYCVPFRQFRDQLRIFGHGSGGPGALVTFDDGELSQMEIAAPLLLEFGIKATYFVTPGFSLGLRGNFWAGNSSGSCRRRDIRSNRTDGRINFSPAVMTAI